MAEARTWNLRAPGGPGLFRVAESFSGFLCSAKPNTPHASSAGQFEFIQDKNLQKHQRPQARTRYLRRADRHGNRLTFNRCWRSACATGRNDNKADGLPLSISD